MKNIVKFVLFIGYTMLVFFVKDANVLTSMILLNSIITLFLKINLKKMLHSLKIFLPFVAITVVLNLLLDSLQEAILIGIRMLICYHATYLFSQTITTLEIADTIEKIGTPLKLFRIETKHIGMMISISICMLPVLKNEITTLIQAMQAKGMPLNIKNINILIQPMFISIFRRTNEMEKTLLSKAYRE